MKGMTFRPEKIQFMAEHPDMELQTRRLGGLKEINQSPDAHKYLGINMLGEHCFELFLNDGTSTIKYVKPPYQVGEVVYIKEAHCLECFEGDGIKDACYRWDFEQGDLIENTCGHRKWRSPLFMPEWAARYFIEITKVEACLLYTSPSPRDQRGSRMPSSA